MALKNVAIFASLVLFGFVGCASGTKIPSNLNIPEGAIVNVVNPENNASGSGFFFTPRCVLTVHHFPELSPDDQLILLDGGWHKAKYVADLPQLDMAIFKTKEAFAFLPILDEYSLPKENDTLYMISRDRLGDIRIIKGVMTKVYPEGVIAATQFKSEKELKRGMSGGVIISPPSVVRGHLVGGHKDNNRLGVWIPLDKSTILALSPIVQDECYR